ncbi:hypothetical protein ACQUWN_21335 [Rossellomorea aquimaris]|uniref:hypothetical protein n=1 Tax=Rossellomorea TaxID=2837508 RepID=UPI001653A552|nr:hypothetical protein [Rossellomorea vietnamensis]
MVNYRKILALHFEEVSQRTISSSTGHSRNTVSDVVQRAKELGVESLNDTMTNPWLEAFLFPEKQAVEWTQGQVPRPTNYYQFGVCNDKNLKSLIIRVGYPPVRRFEPLFAVT